ncbi:MAG: hypothetical protein EZS28_026966, partial [Streblomastix strix]
TGISNWRTNMESRPWSVYNYQPYRRPQVAKIPDILKSKGIKLKRGMTSKQQEKIQQQILSYDDQIAPIEAKFGVLGLIDDTAKRKIYGGDFPYSLQQELLETNIRINNEGRLTFDNYIDNTQRYSSNINKGLDEPSMNLGSRSPVITQEQQLNELMNEGSYRQRQFLSRQLNDEFANQQQATELPQSSVFDEPPEFTLAQENLSEQQENKLDQDEDEYDENTQEYNEKTQKKHRMKQVILGFDDETVADISMITIHFKVLIYFIGEINYVGKVTDIKDTGQDGEDEEEEEKQIEEEEEKQKEEEEKEL